METMPHSVAFDSKIIILMSLYFYQRLGIHEQIITMEMFISLF